MAIGRRGEGIGCKGIRGNSIGVCERCDKHVLGAANKAAKERVSTECGWRRNSGECNSVTRLASLETTKVLCAQDYLPRIMSIPASSNANFWRGNLLTREARNALSTATIWDTLATESLGNPVRRAENCTFPGAAFHLRLVVKGTQTTVAMRLRFRASH
jgi:hypothetical protein